MSRRWYSVELVKELADQFNVYLKEAGIKFEPSEAGNLIHFECYMSEDECSKANNWLRDILRR